jgi:SPP1 gp7 family putative phage head morphogenesis protein
MIDLAALARSKGIRNRVVIIRPIGPRKGTEKQIRRTAVSLVATVIKRHRSDLTDAVRSERSVLTHDGRILSEAMQVFRASLARLLGAAERKIETALMLEGARHADRWIERVNAAIGIDIAAVVRSENIEPSIDNAVQRNVGLITGLTDEVAKRIEQRLLDLVTHGASTKKIADVFVSEFGWAKRRAAVIARDQAAKWSADLNRIRQVSAGITEYDWMCSLDERVRGNPTGKYPTSRPSHWDRHGRRFRWDKRPADGPTDGHPGEPPLCRCRAAAVIRCD